jgi:hypothetical protein
MIIILNTVQVPTNLVYLILISNTPSHPGGVCPPEHDIQCLGVGQLEHCLQCLGVGESEHHIQCLGVGQLKHHIHCLGVGQLEHHIQCLGVGQLEHLNFFCTLCCVSPPYIFLTLDVIWKWQCVNHIMLCCVLQVKIPLTGNMLSCVG